MLDRLDQTHTDFELVSTEIKADSLTPKVGEEDVTRWFELTPVGWSSELLDDSHPRLVRQLFECNFIFQTLTIWRHLQTKLGG